MDSGRQASNKRPVLLMDIVVDNTPVEEYRVDGTTVWVKREDLSCPFPGPGFSKTRGLVAHMRTSLASGIREFGVLDTSTSKAGWGVAYACNVLRIPSTIYYPASQKVTTLPPYQKRAEALGGTVVRLDPVGRARILWNRLNQQWRLREAAELLPLGLRLTEAVNETADELDRTADELKTGSIVVNVSSGTICAGLMWGMIRRRMWPKVIVGVTSHEMDVGRKTASIWDKVRTSMVFGPRSSPSWFRLEITKCKYSDREEESCEFPCNPWYDRKAWRWLKDNIQSLPQPVLFWNIGA